MTHGCCGLRSTTYGLKHDAFGRLCAAIQTAAREVEAGGAAEPAWWEECAAAAERSSHAAA